MGRNTWVLMLAVVSLTAVALVAIAAPIMPRKTRIPDEMRALAQLEKINIEYQAIPSQLARVGLRKADVQRLVQRRMRQHGFKLVSETDVPGITVSFRAMEDDTVPGALGHAAFLELRQSVRLMRLEDASMKLPTATVLAYGLKRDDQAA